MEHCQQLAPTFAALRRSKAPYHQKISALPVKFWSMALHGVSGCPIPDSLLQSLRTQATRALGAAPAGASPLLRLSLCSPATADPGFYQCWLCLVTLRRLCIKQCRFLHLWAHFMQRFDGRLFHGPFSKLLIVLNSIGWRVQTPPFVVDEENLAHDLLSIPLSSLRAIAERAWLRHVASLHQRRDSMSGLTGIDPTLARLDSRQLTATQNARIAALQSGALMFGEAQSRFDLTQSGLCSHCGVPDTKTHRVLSCPLFASARCGHEQALARWDSLPPCLKFHLLPPACAAARDLRTLLHSIPDCSHQFLSKPGEAIQHLFTDGACTQKLSPELSIAAWGVVNASTGQVAASGHLPGICQSAPRAELYAILAAVCWVRHFGVFAVIWGDSFTVAEGLCQLLDGFEPDTHWENQDLWIRICDQVAELQRGQLRIQHVTSHLDPARCVDVFEEWVARWNNHADTVATMANDNRTWTFQQTFQRACSYYEDTAFLLRSLRQVYLHIADLTETSSSHRREVNYEDDVTVADLALPHGTPRCENIAERLPLTWRQDVVHIFPAHLRPIAHRFVQLLVDQDACSTFEFRISWLELVGILWGCDSSVWVPRLSADPRIPIPPPTVAEQLRQTRRIGSNFLQHFGMTHLHVHRLSGVHFGFGFPLDGLLIGVSLEALSHSRLLLKDFAGGQLCRSIADFDRGF